MLAEIYSGKITTWNDPAIKKLNPGVTLPTMKIVTLHRADSSGDTFLFTSYLSAPGPERVAESQRQHHGQLADVPGALAETGNSGMVAGCAANKGCIAYIGISYLQKTQAAGLGTASAANKSGNFLQPTPATISAEASFVHRQHPGQRGDLDDQRPGRDRLPDRQLRVRDRADHPVQRHQAEDIRAFLHWIVHTGQDPTTYLDAGGLPAALRASVGARKSDEPDQSKIGS